MKASTTSSNTHLPAIVTQHGSPFDLETVKLTKSEHIQLKWEANYWHQQFQAAAERENRAQEKIKELEATIRDLKQRLYGKKTEKHPGKSEQENKQSKKPKGQQPGSCGHGRTSRESLPVIPEERDIPDHCCPVCHEALELFPGTEDSDIIEVEVSAHIRRIRRKRYKKCACEKPGIITASPAPRLIPKTAIGVSVWREIILNKVLRNQSTSQYLEHLKHLGCPLSAGTVTGGLHHFTSLFEPLQDRFLKKQLDEELFGADETGWKVFEKVEGKVGYRWYLWVTHSPSVVAYHASPGRNTQVMLDYFQQRNVKKPLFLVCDRYSAYKRLAKLLPWIRLAFCWAHVRRDFLEAARSWPALNDWMLDWVDDIGGLYHLNQQRRLVWDESLALSEQSEAFKTQHQQLSLALDAMEEKRKSALKQTLETPQQQVLKSLGHHWSGLTLFLDHPQIPMDNNSSEQKIRGPVTGKKIYYGSGSVWSAHLLAMLLTVVKTIVLSGLNPDHWLQVYLTACAENQGKAPKDLSPYIPWEMTPNQRHQLQLPRPQPDKIDSS